MHADLVLMIVLEQDHDKPRKFCSTLDLSGNSGTH
jgi:hypothetical protein